MTSSSVLPTPARRAVRALDDNTLAAAVVLIGLGIRLAFALSQRGEEVGGDAYYFHGQANLLADGRGFVNPLTSALEGADLAAAEHPPLYSTYLALWSLVGVRSVTGHLVASALLGTATVVLVLSAGQRLAGPRAGLLAGLAAAVHPNVWVWDGILLSETAAGTAVALFLWLAVRMFERPDVARLVAVGASVGLAALTRSELIVLGVALVPLARLLRTGGTGSPSTRSERPGGSGGSADTRGRGRSGAPPGAAVAAVMAFAALAGVIVPWAAYNQTRFEHPVPLSTGAGLVLVSSNCETTYSGALLGYWDFGCSINGRLRSDLPAREDASVVDRALRRDATDFARDNADRLPVVALARLGRVLGLFRPLQQVALLERSEGVPEWIGAAGLGTWYLLAGLAAIGVRTLRLARVTVVPFVAPMVTVLVVAVTVYGIWRFRMPGDVAVCLLAGVGADALLRSRMEADRAPDRSHGVLGRAVAGQPAAKAAAPRS